MTVHDLQKRVETILSRYIKNASPERYLSDNLYRFVGDAYSVITDRSRQPVTSNSSTISVVGQNGYTIPTDCYDGFEGIMEVEYNSKPLQQVQYRSLQERYYEEWLNPCDLQCTSLFCKYDSETLAYLIPAPQEAGNIIKFLYVQQTAEPTAGNATLPAFVLPYVPYIPEYIVGRVLNMDKQGRGSSLVAQFEQHIVERVRREKRTHNVRSGREGYTVNLDRYRRMYGQPGRKTSPS